MPDEHRKPRSTFSKAPHQLSLPLHSQADFDMIGACGSGVVDLQGCAGLLWARRHGGGGMPAGDLLPVGVA